jgi:hypothetical protein
MTRKHQEFRDYIRDSKECTVYQLHKAVGWQFFGQDGLKFTYETVRQLRNMDLVTLYSRDGKIRIILTPNTQTQPTTG